MALTSVARVKDRFSPSMDGTRDALLERFVSAAADWIGQTGGVQLDRATYTRVFDGRRAGGPCRDLIELDSRHRPVIHAGGDLVTVTEDGVGLTVATGYSQTADVILVGANDFNAPVRLYRRGGPWSCGESQNVTVTYEAGYDGSDLANIPGRIQSLAEEVAWLLFQSQSWVGKGTEAAAGRSVSWEKALSPLARETLGELRRRADA